MRRETIARNDARATMRDRIVNTMRTFRNQIRKATTAICPIAVGTSMARIMPIAVIQTKNPQRAAGFPMQICYLMFLISLPGLRRETMSLFEYFFGRRVFCPLPVGRPCAVRERL